MTFRAILNPQFGSYDNTKNLGIEITGISNENGVRLKIENATHSVPVKFVGNKEDSIYLEPGQVEYKGTIDLNVPEHASQLIISIFVALEKKIEGDSYDLVDIYPVIYHIKEEMVSIFAGKINIEPAFLSVNDICSIKIDSKPNDKVVMSVNDKRFNILTNEEGKGSIHFKGKDILTIKEKGVVQKYPVYFYQSEDQFTTKNFSGSYIHTLPSHVESHADPRCDTLTQQEIEDWLPPDWCQENLCPDGSLPPCDDPCLDPPCVPPIDIPVDTDPAECSNRPVLDDIDNYNDICRINSDAITLLPNGMTLHAYVSVDTDLSSSDSDYNLSKVFIAKDETSLTAKVLAKRDISLEPGRSDENLVLYIGEELYDIIRESLTKYVVYVLILNESFNYKSFQVLEALGPEDNPLFTENPSASRDFHRLVIDTAGGSYSLSTWLFCQPAVFYINTAPTLFLADNIKRLPAIQDNTGRKVSAYNAVIGCNTNYLSLNEDFNVFVVAEANVDGNNQLFLYSFQIGISDNSSDPSIDVLHTYGWKQLTTSGKNKNAKIKVDKNNNLHIFWESDRIGPEQIYYGVAGPSSWSLSHCVLSNIINKQSLLLQKEDKPFEYLDEDILNKLTLEKGDPSANILSLPRETITKSWTVNANRLGDADILSNKKVRIRANTVDDTALAFTSLSPSNGFDISDGNYSKINYQIDFETHLQLFQNNTTLNIPDGESLSKEHIERLYENWKSNFTVQIDEDFSNIPVYADSNNNKFALGKQEGIYDRFIPLMGVYENSNLSGSSPIATDFEIKLSGDNDNVRHFVLCLLPEKVCFKAENSQTEGEFTRDTGSSTNYLATEKQEFYTGKADLVMLFNNANSMDLVAEEEASYSLIRRIGSSFDFYNKHDFNILINYTKLYDEDVSYLLNIKEEDASSYPRLVCTVTLFMDDITVMSHSFLVKSFDTYGNLDIGFGIPSNGQYSANQFIPYNSLVFENTDVDFTFSDIKISSPTYGINNDVITMPSSVDNFIDLIVPDSEYDPSAFVSTSYFDKYSLLSYDFNVFSNFMQVPITVEGYNKEVGVSVGEIDDFHITWQSNRDRYWNIYYSNSTTKTLPFKFDTQITNTSSNSLCPTVSVNRNGARMIVWHDDRDGPYQIYSARSLTGYNFYNNNCKDEIVKNFSNQTNECQISFSFIGNNYSNNYYYFVLEFYTDNAFSDLYASISSNDSVVGWLIDGNAFSASGAEIEYGTTSNISYVVQTSDDVYDKILYVKAKPFSIL